MPATLYRLCAVTLLAVMSVAVAACLMMGAMATMPASHTGHGQHDTSATHIIHSKEMAYSVSIKDITVLALFLTIAFIGWISILPSLLVITASLHTFWIRWRDGLTHLRSLQMRRWLSLFVRSPDFLLTT